MDGGLHRAYLHALLLLGDKPVYCATGTRSAQPAGEARNVGRGAHGVYELVARAVDALVVDAAQLARPQRREGDVQSTARKAMRVAR